MSIFDREVTNITDQETIDELIRMGLIPMKTHVLLVVDMSGSMHPLAEDVRGGYNTYLSSLEEDSDQYSFTVTLFDDKFESLCVGASWENTPRLDRTNYAPRGMTALLDAVGKTIVEFERSTTVGEDEKVLVVVQTDGHENHSTEFTRELIAQMIKEREKTTKWSFTFLGAGPDTWAQAHGMGFQRANTVSYNPVATRSAYSGVSRGTKSFASGQSADVFAAEVATASGGIVHGEPKEEDEK